MTKLNKLTPKMRSSEELKAGGIVADVEENMRYSYILQGLTQSNPHNAKHWLNWSTCLKAMKLRLR